jgi:hypothetical protein
VRYDGLEVLDVDDYMNVFLSMEVIKILDV